MKLYFISFVFILLSVFQVSGQQYVPLNERGYVDSLNKVLAAKNTDSLLARANFLLSDYWHIMDTTKSKAYLLSANRLAQKSPYLKAISYFYEGQYYMANDIKKAEQAYAKAQKELAKYNTNDARQLKASNLFNYGITKLPEKGYEYFIDIILNQVIPLSESIGDTEGTSYYYTQLATAFMYNAQFSKAEKLFDKAILLAQNKHPNSSVLLLAYVTAAGNYCYLLKTKPARKMLDRAALILKPFPESTLYPLYYYNESIYYVSKEMPDKILENADKGMKLAKAYNQKMLYKLLSFRKYEVYLKSNRYKESKEILLDLLSSGLINRDDNNRKSLYQQLAITTSKMGQMAEAYNWLTAYNKINDSLNESKVKEKINALEIKFRNAENQEKIKQLQIEKEKTSLLLQNNRLMIWLFGFVAVFLLILSCFVINHYRHKNKLIRTNAMLEGEERERSRVARDLHDGLGGMLSAVKMNLSGWTANHTIDPELNRIIDQVDDSVNELRYIARNMMPESLLKFGLETALKDLCGSVVSQNTSITFQAFNIESDLRTTVQLTVFRIVQELLSNAIRHAGARNIIVQCSQNSGQFLITVEDDGKGFDPNQLELKKGMGLNSIDNRVKYLDGKMEILSNREEKGTTLNIELNVAG